MNKKKIAAAMLLAGTASMAATSGTLWNWSNVDAYSAQVMTPSVKAAVAAGNEPYTVEAGWWYGYADDKNSGTSTFAPLNSVGELDVSCSNSSTGDCSGATALSSTAQALKATLTLNAGYQYRFAGIAFKWMAPVGGADVTTDISANSGFCLTYALATTGKFYMVMDMDQTKYNPTDNGFPVKTLPATASWSTLSLPWAGFVGTYGTKMTGAQGAAEANSLQFKLEGSVGATATINIADLGWLADGCGSPSASPVLEGSSSSVVSSVGASSLKMAMAGRTLAFSGLKGTAKVEVINLQGQVVANATIGAASNSLNLSRLDGGVYMVRASGKDLSFSQRVVLK
jgi:hypothetical protein